MTPYGKNISVLSDTSQGKISYSCVFLWIFGHQKDINCSMNTTDLFWQRIDMVLLDYNMSIAQLSRGTKISYDSFKSWRSKHRIPDVESLIKISDFLDLSLDALLKGKNNQNKHSQPQMFAENPVLNQIIKICIERPRIMDSIAILLGICPEKTEAIRPRTVGERISIALRAAGMTDFDVEEVCDIGADEISEFVDGYVQPSKEQLETISRITGCSLSFLEYGDMGRNDIRATYVK